MEPNDVIKAQLMTARDLERTLQRMARQIVEMFDLDETRSGSFGLIGMQSRGVFIASRLEKIIQTITGSAVPLGILDATMYRDDFRMRLKQPVVRETKIDFDIDGRDLVLVDDVLFTGRTTRAGLDALTDLGRPASVHFLVIVDRGLRELPIKADFVGRKIPTLPGEEVRVRIAEMDDQEGVWLVEHPTTPTT
ncbi:MAG: bifunctional pyr operon transcriptional regulator/uracil phosphoribosyltransferase PyrR [Bacteroidetes Order II. Incertae sedis bacterium]|jgi:pyrimidine operon attenuation protein/uracil phosphoribosyltransferase|nr:bifunctional pyr operon transcriptional regulator/uracil phosphoribosyltransferase PyrR [Bacteroidetes Order II. bacterium]MBT4053315.1 bifunctional pyr operon transcriptional regulator/uracil phosphoribosyltransferase PyrR [Bacteroidetes Order II. bacterium]MBT4602627.1 bifunctional pyr operon transcriptional regulator/uracil phosphoribosyltransferase PyrR [Bacteroidetes Order II. bacterium]MBT5249275.1 bifunctional pyr operon transcriptional regulator/uracil phosphoribosyltransferase PyrR [